MKIKTLIFSLFIVFTNQQQVQASGFPLAPDLTITTGKLCDRPDEHRYPENIAYCERDVAVQTKEIVISEYDQKNGFSISKLPRADFKIDHLIPLCAGGSNDISNLWPQHKSVYAKTDPIEPVLCEKMSRGRLKQADAVRLIIEAKTFHDKIPSLTRFVNKL